MASVGQQEPADWGERGLSDKTAQEISARCLPPPNAGRPLRALPAPNLSRNLNSRHDPDPLHALPALPPVHTETGVCPHPEVEKLRLLWHALGNLFVGYRISRAAVVDSFQRNWAIPLQGPSPEVERLRSRTEAVVARFPAPDNGAIDAFRGIAEFVSTNFVPVLPEIGDTLAAVACGPHGPERLWSVAHVLRDLPAQSNSDNIQNVLGSIRRLSTTLTPAEWSVVVRSWETVGTEHGALRTEHGVLRTECRAVETFTRLLALVLEGAERPSQREGVFTVLRTAHSGAGWCPLEALRCVAGTPHRVPETPPVLEEGALATLAHDLSARAPLFANEKFPIDLRRDLFFSRAFLERVRELSGGLDTSCEPLIRALARARAQENLFVHDSSAELHLRQRCEFHAARKISPAKVIEEEIDHRLLGKMTATADDAVVALLYPHDDDQKWKAGEYLKHNYGGDQHPARVESPEHAALFRQTAEVFRGLLEDYRSFGGYAADTRRFDRARHSSLTQCMIDLADAVEYVYSGEPFLFPGSGILIKGLDPRRFLSTLKSSDDPFAEHRVATPWMSGPIDTMQECTYIPLRGSFAILPPSETEDTRFTIDLGVRREPYAYLFFNDHFANPARYKAFLVPALVLFGKLKGTTIPSWAWEQGERKASASVHERDLTPLGLRDVCRRYGAPLLDLGTPSVFTGGLCNAFPVGSDPYWGWEKDQPESWRDLHGHRHKSWATGHYVGQLTNVQDRFFQKFRAGHEDVYETVKHYRALLTMFKLAKSLWNKGMTLSREGDAAFERYAEEKERDNPFFTGEAPFIFSESDLAGQQVDMGDSGLNPFDTDDSSLNPQEVTHVSFRRLDEAIRIHRWYHSPDAHDRRHYVLRPAPTYRYAAPPLGYYALDTVSLTLYTPNGGEFHLKGKSREYQEMVWQSQVMPYFRETDIDLRFFEEVNT